VAERVFYLLYLENLRDFPSALLLPSPFFGLFLVCDGSRAADADIAAAANSALAQGAAVVEIWGPNTDRIYAAFERLGQRNPGEDDVPVVITTHLKDTSLDQALWYFRNISVPVEEYTPGCDSFLAVVIGDRAWADTARRELEIPIEGCLERRS
jgi:hypothetical protein